MSASDKDLLTDYSHRKDAEAFATLVERYQSLVYATTLRRLGNRADAEEVTQEVFLSLAMNAHKISADKLGGWLFRSAINASHSRVRSDQARLTREKARATPDHRSDPSHEWRQIEEVLDACLAELPRDSRELLIQRFFANRSQSELAQAFGVDQATVSRRLQKAVEQLRRLMAGKGVSLTAAALVAGLSAHATAATVPSELSTALNKVGVAGVGKKIAPFLPLPVIANFFWPTISLLIAVFIASAVLLGALAGSDTAPASPVVGLTQPPPMDVVVELTRLDYSQQLASSGLAINGQGRIVVYNDLPEELAGVYVGGNNTFQRLARLPGHVRRSLVIGPRSVAAGYDQYVALIRGDRVRALSEAGAVDVAPSINGRDWVAWIDSEPVSRIRLYDGKSVRTLHEAGDRFTRFDEVCLNDVGDVAFRASTNQGVEGIYLGRQGKVAVVAEVGEEFKGFRPWFSFNNDGQIAFIAQGVNGTETLYLGNDSGLEPLVRTGDYFSDIVQASLNNAGSIAFSARRPADPADEPIAGLYLWDGSKVVELLPRGEQMGDKSLEGVILWRDCFNDAGQVAVLADFGPGELSAILRLKTNDLALVD